MSPDTCRNAKVYGPCVCGKSIIYRSFPRPSKENEHLGAPLDACLREVSKLLERLTESIKTFCGKSMSI